MRIATITYSDAQNYGALLQAYALANYVERMGHQVHLIDYRAFDKRCWKPRKTVSDIFFTTLLMHQGKRRLKRFLEFRNRLPLTRFCANSQDLETLNPSFDAFISGSDQVWNCNVRVNDDFFLRFVQSGKKKISYAPSFGSDSIPEDRKEKVGRYIQDFDFVSARETSGAKLVEELTGKRPPVVVDPVFLLERETWEGFLSNNTLPAKPYIFVYTTQVSERLEKVVQTAHKKTGYPVVSTQFIPHCGCKVRKDIGPVEFLGWIHGAKQVISTSFHATAFSVIFEKDFCVVPHSQTGARVTNLLEDLGLSEAVVTDVSGWREDFAFSWEEPRRILAEKKAFSKEYLKKALGGECCA